MAYFMIKYWFFMTIKSFELLNKQSINSDVEVDMTKGYSKTIMTHQ